MVQLTAVFEKAKEGGYIAYIAEIDGINTQGETIAEAEENLIDAFYLMMEARKEDLENKNNIVAAPLFSLHQIQNEKKQIN